MKKASNKNKGKTYKERFLSLFSGVSSSLSFLGGWQVCHSLCLGIIALLSLIGITVVGMPLLFLQQYNIYFWSLAVLLLLPVLFLYLKKKAGMHKPLLLANIGIIIAAIPLNIGDFIIAFWAVGFGTVALSILMHYKKI